MADTFTTVLNLTKPEVGASTSTWGTKLNADLDDLDALFDAGPVLLLAKGGTGAATAAGARTNLGLGTMAVQSAVAVAVTGGTLAGITGLAGTFNLSTTGSLTAGGGATIGGEVWAQTVGFKFPDGTVQATATSTSGAANWQTVTSPAGFTTVNGAAYYITVELTLTLHSGAANDVVHFASGLDAAHTFTINPTAGQTIMGDTTLVVDRASAAFDVVLIGTDWRIV